MTYEAKERTPFPYGQVAYPAFLGVKPGDYVIMKGILDEKFPCQVRNLDLEML